MKKIWRASFKKIGKNNLKTNFESIEKSTWKKKQLENLKKERKAN